MTRNLTFPLEKFLSELEQIVNMDSGSSDIEGCRKVASFFEKKLQSIGCRTKYMECGEDSRPVIRAVSPNAPLILSETGKSFDFMLSGHIDTVFPHGTCARRPFHTEGDSAYGPGTVDMKAGALLMAYIAEAIISCDPDITFCLVLSSDEEIGSSDSAPILIDLGRHSHRAFVFEGQRKNGQFVCARKGCAKYDISITGIASHAGTAPRMGASAIVEMADWIKKLDSLKRYERGTSINTGLIEGGSALNVVPDWCLAQAEVRYTDIRELQRVEAAMTSFASKPHVKGTAGEFKRISNTPPLEVTPQTKCLMEQMETFGRLQNKKPPITFVSAGGLSDANHIADAGIPVIDGCGPGGGFPHSEKEFLTISTVPERFSLMVGLLEYLYSMPLTS